MWRISVCYHCNNNRHDECTIILRYYNNNKPCKCKKCKNKSKSDSLNNEIIDCKRCKDPIKFHLIFDKNGKKFIECSLCKCYRKL